MWNLENKTNEQTEQNRNRVMATENKQMAARGGGGKEKTQAREIQRYKLSVLK